MCSSITMAKKASLVLTNQPVRLFCVMIDLSSGSQTVMGEQMRVGTQRTWGEINKFVFNSIWAVFTF